MRQRLFCYIGAISALLLLPYAWESIQPNALVLTLSLLLVGGLTWLFVGLRKETALQAPKFLLPLLSLVFYQGLLLTITPVPAYGVYFVVTGLFISLIFVFIADSTRDDQGLFCWESVFLIIGFVLASIEIVSALVWYWDWVSISGTLLEPPPVSLRIPGYLLGHPNFFGGYLNLFIPIVIIRIVQTHGTRRTTLVAALLIFLIAQFFSSSRSAWLALLGGIGVMLLLGFIDPIRAAIRKRKPPSLLKNGKGQFAAIAIVLLVLCLVIAPLVINQLNRGAHGTPGQRIELWIYAVEQIRESPIWGYGPGSSGFLYVLRANAIGADEVYHSHNLFLQIMLVSGVIGLGILLWGLYLIVRALSGAWRRTAGDLNARHTLAGYAGVGAALTIHSMLDYIYDPLLLTIGACFVVAVIYHFAPNNEFFLVKRKVAMPMLALLVGLCALGILYTQQGNSDYWRGVQKAYWGDWQGAEEDVCSAAVASPEKTFFSFQCSLAQAYNAYDNDNDTKLRSAKELQQQALSVDPNWYLHWANLASYEWEVGNYQQAHTHMQRAADMAPNVVFLRLNLGWMAEQLGDREEANSHYRYVVCLNPNILNTPFSERSDLLSEVDLEECSTEKQSQIVNAQSTPLQEGIQALQDGNPELARSRFSQANEENLQNPVPYAYLALANQRLGNDELAWKYAQTSLFIYETSPSVLQIVAQVALEQGNEELAMDFLYRAFQGYRNAGLSRRAYLGMYRGLSLPTDNSPYLVSSGFLRETQDLYVLLIDYLMKIGETEKADDVSEWLAHIAS